MPVARRTPTPSEIYSRLDRSRLQAKGWPLFPVRTRIPVVFSARPLDDLIVALSSVRQEFSSESWLRSASQDEFIGLAKRPRSTPFGIPERSASIWKLNTSTVTSSYELTTGGIDPRMLDAGREGHWGLAGMRERATKIDGLLKIPSSATNGTEVQLSVLGGVAFERPSPQHSPN